MDKIMIIAEAGVNHNGDVELAKQLIDAAKWAGADAVKFQTFRAEHLASKSAPQAEYQRQTAGTVERQLDLLKRLELSYDEFNALSSYCVQQGILFLSSAFDLGSIDWLEQLKLPLYKVPSGEITNLPYLLKLASTGKPVLLSTGMSEFAEVEAAFRVLRENGAGPITLLHCNTQYPTPFQDANLMAMLTLKERLGAPVGYSDHTLGIEVPIAAAALGAVVIEKHFTLDKSLSGPDHKASLDPQELKAMVQGVRIVEAALGSRMKRPSPSELENRIATRKSIVAVRAIQKGELFTPDNLTVKRPGSGVSPMKWFQVLGTRAARDFSVDELIAL